MAEIAIPMAVLGVMYIISNKEKKEGFTNQPLPNVNRPIVNWPTERKKAVDGYVVEGKRDLLNETNVQTYQGY